MNISETIFSNISDKIKTWNLEDIYAISIYIESEEDDPRIPTITLGYNTIKNWKENISSASDDLEAKWNYAFWLQNAEYQFGLTKNDKEIVKKWIVDNDLYYSDEDEENDFDRCMELGEQIEISFVDTCVKIAEKVQREILSTLSTKSIPVLVHELEYYDIIAEQNKIANPNGEAIEFIKWIADM